MKELAWSSAEDEILILMVHKNKESKYTFERIALYLNALGRNGQVSPFRTERACKRRFRDLRRKANNE